MKIQIENQDGIYTVETKEEFVTIVDYIENLIVPVLSAAGFSSTTIKEYLGE